ncbi:hypothetical protein [Burkholderia ubonensis]|uniref:Uncharacterized protein n=1 Tax=Burkholderia ubonensis TaxID=101571 RepID=A0ABD4E9Q0_9BURK|nr:hypothetical protein [Burkholderia ubonensis]KVN92549.1 hypothetical protein WJ68_33545 [Burkholderia ubonensis]
MKTLQPHQQRVVDEKAVVDAEVARLLHLMRSIEHASATNAGLPASDKAHIRAQYQSKVIEAQLLAERIAEFEQP